MEQAGQLFGTEVPAASKAKLANPHVQLHAVKLVQLRSKVERNSLLASRYQSWAINEFEANQGTLEGLSEEQQKLIGDLQEAKMAFLEAYFLVDASRGALMELIKSNNKPGPPPPSSGSMPEELEQQWLNKVVNMGSTPLAQRVMRNLLCFLGGYLAAQETISQGQCSHCVERHPQDLKERAI